MARADPVYRACRSTSARTSSSLCGARLLCDDEVVVEAAAQLPERIEHVGVAAGHARAEVEPDLTEDDDRPRGHVLAPVVADALDHRDGARVAHREPLAGGACAEQLAPGRPVQGRVPDEARVAGIVGWRRDHDSAAAHGLAHVVVRLSDEVELNPGREERAEALPAEPSKCARRRPGGGIAP